MGDNTDGKIDEPATGPDGVIPELQRRLRRQRKVLVSLIVLLALVLSVPALWIVVRRIRTAPEPEVLAQYSGNVVGFIDDGEQGERYTFGINHEKLPDVTMTSAQAIVSEASVPAATTVSICRFNPNQDDDTGGIGAAKGDLAEWCSEVISVEGQDLGELDEHDSLIVTIVPLVDGRVSVTGFDFTYDHNGRRSTEQISVEMSVGHTF